MLEKLKWLNTLFAVRRISKLVCSPNLMFLNTEALTTFCGASLRALRGTLPNGVPNTACAVRALMIKRTSFGVTGTMFALLLSRPQGGRVHWLRALKLISCVAASPHAAGALMFVDVRQASPAKMP